ncbi:uncharacterized protein NFIA_079910 [Aspergillus fischeri NRRL 181]|uniref:Uncharacterized protein n=1 Tax=Neosartorya fischeri (strain ATCC 1020 / DSM 3700 / CBS 544.65 / FGSC A1164 / JCM 1740 / NRRL 181 / WB 181) TaxID=331117 RepID=A1DF92_NEOFI|nr:uncharacterized protein NFIA_079910 [Aspergillus fischeri NRRL 181]EAW18049.1 hypothetical protein NFIA_079910 [Aspergillus fischeri NRRL 181]KAG2016699.1 hypothetical protein GB937_006178 [Aspergillus fischeri]
MNSFLMAHRKTLPSKLPKGATVKQVLQAKMALSEDPDGIPEETETDEPHGYLEEDAAIKAAKEAKVKRVLLVETDIAEDLDCLLEMDEKPSEKANGGLWSLELHIELGF